MEEINKYESGNINTKWIDNIYENLKNLETFERLSREGCQSILEYLQIPYEDRKIIIADIQFKNLKLMLNELRLLITDASLVIGEEQTEKYKNILIKLDEAFNDRKLFIIERYSAIQDRIVSSDTTAYFKDTLNFLSFIRERLIYLLRNILYVKPQPIKKSNDTKQWS